MRPFLLLTAVAVGCSFVTAANATGTQTAAAADAAVKPIAVAPQTVPEVTKVGKASEPDAAAATPAPPASPALPPPAVPLSPAGPEPTAEAPKPPPQPTLVIKIDLSRQRMDVTANGNMIHSWPISSGRAGYETPRGTFKPQWAAKMWYSRKYDLAPMPHAVFINGGVAVHATSSVGLLGQPASHGCIRLAPGNAALFYSLVHKHGFQQTRVQVFGTPPLPSVARSRNRAPENVVAARGPTPRPVAAALRAANRYADGPMVRPGMVYLRPGQANYGSNSFVHNGIRYVRVR